MHVICYCILFHLSKINYKLKKIFKSIINKWDTVDKK